MLERLDSGLYEYGSFEIKEEPFYHRLSANCGAASIGAKKNVARKQNCSVVLP
uniref:Uncharacterized protein n=1 Tax=Uncultured archaeon GZfos26G2 TaxID=3386331 RepID=Q648I7_UNCAG|nr:hypothetical protein GZ37D1_37 [uncultured archaeon GZfos37D1]